jgi:general secretion pathway protein I
MKNESGFTLVEVLVAVAIVAITLSTGLRVSGGQIQNIERQRDVLRAQLCAENELIKWRLLRQLPAIGENRFVCEQADEVFEGKLDVKPTPNPSFHKLDAIVFKSQGEDKEAYTLIRLSTLLGRF